jgi:hypothetical protein
MIGQWQGQWQGQWEGAGEQNPGAMYGTASISFTVTGTLTATVVEAPVVEVAGGGGTRRWVDEYLEEQQRIADRIRSQNQTIIAMVVSLVSEDAE